MNENNFWIQKISRERCIIIFVLKFFEMCFDLYYYSLAIFSFAKKVHCRLFSPKHPLPPKWVLLSGKQKCECGEQWYFKNPCLAMHNSLQTHKNQHNSLIVLHSPCANKTSGAHQVWLSESHTLRSKKFKWIWRWSQSSLNLLLKSLIEESLKKFVSHANLYQWNTTYAIAFVKIQVQVPFCFKIMASLPCLSCPPLMERAPHHEVWSAQGKQLLHQPAKSPVETPELVQSNQEGNTQQWDRNE